VGAVGFTSGDPRKLNRTGYTKGDVIAADTAGALTAVPVGTDTEVLTADSSDPEGVDWQPGGGGGGGGTPSNTVVAETSYGQASTPGAAATFSRGDHTHGSPSLTGTAPATALGIGQAAALGAATAPARADHVHPVAGSGTPSTSAVGDVAAQGAAVTFSRSDHAHGREAFAVPGASAVGDTVSAGAASTLARSDHRHGRESFGAVTAQTSFGAASADGVAATLSRSDHTHGTPAAPSVPSAATTVVAETSYGAATDVGVTTTYAREDHSHGSPSLTAATPAAESIGASGVVGVAATPARADHVHAMPAAAIAGSSAVGDVATAGVAATFARSDHVHGREAFGAVTAETGFGQASGNGAASTVARSDHTHGTPSLGTSGTTAAAGNDARIVNAVQQTLFDAKGDLIAATAADTPARVPVGTDGQFLRANSATGTGLEWDTATAADVGAAPTAHTHAAADVVSGTLAVDRGGTGIGSYTANNYVRASAATTLEQRTPVQVVGDIGAVPHALADAKGDLLAASAADTFTRLPAGTNGQVLTADSAEATGLKWAAAGGGGGAPAFMQLRVSSGNAAGSNTSGAWIVINNGTVDFQVTLPAAVGDLLEVAARYLMTSGTGFKGVDYGVWDGAAVVQFSSTGTATAAFEGEPSLTDQLKQTTGPVHFTVTAPMIVGGNVTVALVRRGEGGAGQIHADSNYPFIMWAKNYGQ
jgi:hypothetical protein